ncbi:MAG TPA: hypothetical protein VLJ16_03600, partial [Acidobacteriota bacterium]|nr:hypothetical protein [Acidobacteriota bacterium]
ALMEGERIEFALSVTIYNEDRGRLSEAVRAYSRYRHFDGILAVLARDGGDPSGQNVQLRDEYDGLERGLGLEPVAYVPSSRSETEARWLVYYYLVDAAGTRVHALGPGLDRAFRRFFRLVAGRRFYTTNHGPAELKWIIGPIALFEALTSPRRLASLARLFRRAGSLKGLRLHFIAIQVPPELETDGTIKIICRDCPDATIRNGRLVPVCLADLVSPYIAPRGLAAGAPGP